MSWPSKLTEDDVREIRRWIKRGVSDGALGRRHHVTRGAIQHIRSGRNWRRVR